MESLPAEGVATGQTDDDLLPDEAGAADEWTSEVSAPFRDIPRWIWTIFLIAWATLFLLFPLFFATDSGAAFAVTIAILFAGMAFGLPIAMTAQAPRTDGRRTGPIVTRSGSLSQGAAATQILLIPVAAVLGLTAFILLAK
jgi:hypothetical protein